MNFMSLFGNLSPNAKLGATAGGTAGIVAAAAMAITGHWQLLLLLLLLVVMAVAAFVIFRVLLGWWEKRKSRPMEKSLAGNASSSPQQVSGAKKLADLDSLRRVFASGVEKFRSAGKDLYSLPWYVLVGQPGSGKTEAIRHSAIGFPPGLQDQLQGAGGTINMNWWFTNHAIILDTAGRLMFEEVSPGSTSEWQEFLKLLRQHRPNCPINGMLLVIPADSLLKDSTENIAKNAGKIAQQLDNIQRTLGVRFPVFIFITKSDYLPGFSQFFDDLTDPQLQHQIMGWSNPGQLDDPFNIEAVESHLRQVRDRLTERRGRLLADPVHTEDPAGHRMDQVDALFALPESLLKITPRLKQYLETIFVPGEWSAKPLFLRGIYFTSSMSDGKSLDADLAAALGVAVDALPASGVWRRDRAYFLRDLFLQKIFKERGLVTRASNAMKQQRRRKMAVLTAGFLAVALLLGTTFYAFYELENSVGNLGQYWQAAAKVYTSSGRRFMAMIVPKNKTVGKPAYVYQGHTNKLLGQSLAKFYAQGFNLVEKPIAVPWIFKPVAFLGGGVNTRQRRAYLRIFNAAVIAPVIKAAGAKLSVAPLHDTSPNIQRLEIRTRALQELINIAACEYQPRLSADAPRGRKDFDGLVRYVLSPADYKIYKTYQADSVRTVLKTLYASRHNWPPAGIGPAGSPELAAVIAHGIRSVTAGWNRAVGTGNQSLQRLIELKASLQQFQSSEQALMRWASTYSGPNDVSAAEIRRVAGLLSQMQAADAKIRLDLPSIGSHGTFYGAYLADARALLDRRKAVFKQLNRDTAWIDSLTKSPATAPAGIPGMAAAHLGMANEPPAKVRLILAQARSNLLAQIAGEHSPIGAQGRQEINGLDGLFLSRAGARRQITLREAVYAAIAALRSGPAAPDSILALKAWLNEFSDLTERIHTQIHRTAATLKTTGPAAARNYNARAMQAADAAFGLLQSNRLGNVLGKAISQAPSTMAAAETLVTQEVTAGTFRSPVKPAILFAPGAGRPYAAQFCPAAATALLDGWYSMGSMLAAAGGAKSVPITGAAGLMQRFQSHSTGLNGYRQAYFHYWLSELREGLGVAPPGNHWTAYLSQLQAVQIDQLFLALEKMGNQAAAAIKAAPPPTSLLRRTAAAQRNIRAADGMLNQRLFARSVRHRLNRWTQLSANPDSARDQLLAQTPINLYHRYILATPANPDYASTYISSLLMAGLRTLAQHSQRQADAVLSAVQAAPYFPLFIPTTPVAPFQHEWSAAGLRRLAHGLSSLPRAATLSGTVLTPNSAVNRQLRLLQGNISYWHFGYSRATVAAIRKIMTALLGNGSGRPLVCRLRITQAMKSDLAANTVQVIWPYLTVNDNGNRIGTANFRSATAEDLGKLSLPEKPGAILRLNFYETDPAMAGAKVNHSLVFHGPWAALKLLARYHGRTTDGKLWVVHIVTKDQFGKTRTMRLELLFSRPLPPLTSWPHAKK